MTLDHRNSRAGAHPGASHATHTLDGGEHETPLPRYADLFGAEGQSELEGVR